MIKQFTFNMFGVNTYVVSNSGEAMIVDPGMTSEAEVRQIADYIATNGLKVTQIVNTHLHLDHLFGNAAMERLYGLPSRAAEADFPFAYQLPAQARLFGLPADAFQAPTALEPLADGDIISLGKLSIEVIATPGHSPGGLCLYCAEQGWLISGDTLFNSSVGRTDLPGGNHSQLINSIRTRLLSLPDLTTVYPGHGPATTIGTESITNPFL